MVLFQYKAIDAHGKSVIGQIEASNDADLEQRLKRMGLDMISHRPARRRGNRLGSRKVGRAELITFCFHLEQLVRAGVPLLEGLMDLRDSVTNLRFRETIAALIADIEGGKTLSQAMERFPKIFNRVFINLIRAGEQSGTLPEILAELTETLKWQDELASHTKKVVMYPAFVAIVVMGVIFFLMTYLVPQLVSFIQNMGNELPAHTRALIFISDIFREYWYLILAAPFVVIFGLRYLRRVHPGTRYFTDGLLLRLWFIGPILRKIILARFANNFALMYSTGISIIECIKINETLADNKVIEGALERAHMQIADGTGLSSSFETTELFPPLIIRMIRVGENTGALDQALSNVSYFYYREIKESIERVQKLIEPVLTVILGIMLGWLMLSVLGPIYDIIGNIRM
ncbi:MAG TPA: type II secretion system F family protein [Gammaproteobacteria bacterium]|nr:type II secretion system F family protein [Gammaproteobacteria bacterium]